MKQAKRKRTYGAMLLEAALCLMVNIPLVIGGLEFGWYLNMRQGLVGAAGQAVRNTGGQAASQAAQVYLIGMGFPDSIIDALDTQITNVNLGNNGKGSRATVSLPTSSMFMFGGATGNLLAAIGQNTVSESAVLRDTTYKETGGPNQ